MVVPVEQTCPVCGDLFMGSDVVGLPCMNCASMGVLDDTLLTNLATVDKDDSTETETEESDADTVQNRSLSERSVDR